MIVPVIERIAPELSVRREVIRRAACHRLRLTLRVELKELGVRPGIRRIRRDINRQVADNRDAVRGRIVLQALPLLVEQHLRPGIEINLGLMRLPEIVQCRAVPLPERLCPAEITLAALRIFDGAIQAVLPGLGVQSSDGGLIARLVLGFSDSLRLRYRRTVETFPEALVCAPEQHFTRLVNTAVVNPARIARVPLASKFLLGEQPERLQFLEVDEIRIARKTRERLVRRVAVAGRSERQNLPVTLPRFLQAVNPVVGLD